MGLVWKGNRAERFGREEVFSGERVSAVLGGGYSSGEGVECG